MRRLLMAGIVAVTLAGVLGIARRAEAINEPILMGPGNCADYYVAFISAGGYFDDWYAFAAFGADFYYFIGIAPDENGNGIYFDGYCYQ